MLFFIRMHRTVADLPIHENESLAPYTSLGIGGPARFLMVATTEDEIRGALDYAKARGCPVFILGGGSNVVVADAGFPGLVIKVEIPGIRQIEDSGSISVGAGVEWDVFVQYCVDRNLAGIECLSGIPGKVGAAPIQNVGAYGEEVSDVIDGVRALERNSASIVQLGRTDCGFAYRSSIFNTTQRDRYIILSVDFALRRDGRPRIRYPDLQRRFGGDAPEPTIRQVREAVLQIRESKGMLSPGKDPDSKSAGSFFKNPILSAEAADHVEAEARRRGLLALQESMPRFPAPDGKVKVPAAWIIERAGFHKGYIRGRAGISSKHALALINRGGADARDITGLMNQIQECVFAFFGIYLEPEPVFIGFGGL